jgi:hypothetical protein
MRLTQSLRTVLITAFVSEIQLYPCTIMAQEPASSGRQPTTWLPHIPPCPLPPAASAQVVRRPHMLGHRGDRPQVPHVDEGSVHVTGVARVANTRSHERQGVAALG